MSTFVQFDSFPNSKEANASEKLLRCNANRDESEDNFNSSLRDLETLGTRSAGFNSEEKFLASRGREVNAST